MHVENSCANNENIIKHNDIECSVEHEKINAFSENMDVSADSLEEGEVVKCTVDKHLNIFLNRVNGLGFSIICGKLLYKISQ